MYVDDSNCDSSDNANGNYDGDCDDNNKMMMMMVLVIVITMVRPLIMIMTFDTILRSEICNLNNPEQYATQIIAILKA